VLLVGGLVSREGRRHAVKLDKTCQSSKEKGSTAKRERKGKDSEEREEGEGLTDLRDSKISVCSIVVGNEHLGLALLRSRRRREILDVRVGVGLAGPFLDGSHEGKESFRLAELQRRRTDQPHCFTHTLIERKATESKSREEDM
jgi:hypothetical protein